ncbi:MAG TPA: DUF1501 domain-containing protein [Pirellulales bacterium]|nr:DUF1501 domain-containing protein [Pirellulales bacterium]
MLTILGKSQGGFCDGLTRRNFLKIGGLAMGGLSLPQVLRAESDSGTKRSHKAVIMIFLPGGPPHLDMWDMKPNAPLEVRGEFEAIRTNVPGIEMCEHFPRLATMMDKVAVLRSIVGAVDEHASFQCQTGRLRRNQAPGGWPSIGSVVAKLQGPAHPAVPPFIGLAPKMGHMEWADSGTPGFLGVPYSPFKPSVGEGKADMVLNGVTLDRLNDRKALLAGFDRFRRDADASGMMAGLDRFNEQAFNVLTSQRLLEALDIEREDATIRERYGHGDPKNRDDGGPKLMEHFLMARRLVEAGARCVTLAFSRWDWHGQTFAAGRQDIPMLDQGLAALIQDLHERGLEKDVSVVVWGEFGRTPKVNKDAGRDHYPAVNSGLLIGGGMRTGQVIGSTDRNGAEVKDRPVYFLEVFATLYHCLGIDTMQTTLRDLSGRPQYLCDQYQPLPELV